MIKELELKEKQLIEQLSDIRHQIRDERERIAFEKYGVGIGCVVKDQKGIEYKVVAITCFNSQGKPWLEGMKKNKNGEFGGARRNLYWEWELVSRQGEEQ